MKRKEMSYAAFADELGISKSQLHDWIHEAHEPRLETLRDIAHKLGCSLADLIEAA